MISHLATGLIRKANLQHNQARDILGLIREKKIAYFVSMQDLEFWQGPQGIVQTHFPALGHLLHVERGVGQGWNIYVDSRAAANDLEA